MTVGLTESHKDHFLHCDIPKYTSVLFCDLPGLQQAATFPTFCVCDPESFFDYC